MNRIRTALEEQLDSVYVELMLDTMTVDSCDADNLIIHVDSPFQHSYAANKDLIAVILYCHEDLIHYRVVSGKGSGRVHSVCLSFTEEGYKFCFHYAVEAIAAVDPELAQSIYTNIKQKCAEAMADLSEQEFSS